MLVKTDLAEIFLKSFVQELIQCSKPAPELEEEKISTIYISPKSLSKKNTIVMLSEFTKSAQISPLKIRPISGTNQLTKQIPQREKFLPSRKTDSIQQPKIHSQQNTPEIPAIDKLNFLIRDPAVTEIECAGSDQPILVKKAGVIQRTKAVLSIEEIYSLIAEFSQKTKIPVIEGTFKAALENLILTAILSETLGPRFILQKKTPFQEEFSK